MGDLMDYNKIIYILAAVFIVLLIAGFAVFGTGFAKKDSAIKVISENALNDGDYFSVQLSDADGNPLANQLVNITIIDSNGGENRQQVTTDSSGNGMLQLNGLSPNEYTFKVDYGGNNDYKGCNTTIKINILEKVVQTQSTTSDDDNYFNGYSRSDFSKGQQAAIDDARAHGYASPADYYKATGKSAGQGY